MGTRHSFQVVFSGAGWFGILAIELGQLYFPGKADFGEQPDAIVVGVDFIPGKTVARGDWVGVVIVVPAFTTADQRDPPVVARVVAGFKATAAPEMRC